MIWGDAAQPRLRRAGLLRQDHAHREQPGLNRTARLAGRSHPAAYTVTDRPREDWLEIPVPALVAEDTWARAQQRLADNKRYAARNSQDPSLLQGICACASCGYAYYRDLDHAPPTRRSTTTAASARMTTATSTAGSATTSRSAPTTSTPLVWDHITGLLADPALIRAEINKRLAQLRTADPTTAQRSASTQALAKASRGDQPAHQRLPRRADLPRRAARRMPDLRSRQTSLRSQLDALDNQLADREVYLNLADDLEDFLTGLRDKAATAHRRRTPARPAPARQRRPHRPRQDHHPTLHPRPQQHRQPDP